MRREDSASGYDLEVEVAHPGQVSPQSGKSGPSRTVITVREAGVLTPLTAAVVRPTGSAILTAIVICAPGLAIRITAAV